VDGSQRQYGLCGCDCGQATTLAERDDPKLGWVKGQSKQFIHGHNARIAHRYNEVDTGFETPCWIWLLAKNEHGYGRCYDPETGRMSMAHRKYYEDHVGPIPPGYQLDHLCKMPACVFWAHLEPVTARENVRRGRAAKLTQADVDAIRASRDRQWVLARRYGIHQSQVSRIKNWLTWR
jgi:hypothetical protein